MEANNNYKNIWDSTLKLIQEKVNDNQVFNAFFVDTKILDIKDGIVVVGTNNSFVAQILNRKYLDLMMETIRVTTATDFKIEVVDENLYKVEEKPVVSVAKQEAFVSGLISKFTFDSFVVGESNREAYLASFATATEPGQFYNPLFIYGRSGLGKTHLIHAIGNYIKEKNPNYKILYKSVDDFVEDVIKAYKETGIESLKELYKNVDVFLLDDVQFLSSKEKSKEVLFSIFNSLINNGKQIILTSDRPPYELKNLEERLVGRFSAGLTVEVKNLEYETAYKILKKKIEALDVSNDSISEEVIEYIAKNHSGDVRKLEGALNKILFYAITFNPSDQITMDVVSKTFNILRNESDPKALTTDKIKTAVSEYYSISVSQLESKVRTANITTARHIGMYLCRKYLDVSLNQIGEAFGGKDHATVINAIEKVENLCKENLSYQAAIEDIKKVLGIQ